MEKIFCCGDDRTLRKFVNKNKTIICYYLDECPQCVTAKIILLENQVLTKTCGKNARKLFQKFRPFIKEVKTPMQKVVLSYIPLKYYKPVDKFTQKEVYSGSEVFSGVVRKAEVRIFSV